MFSLCEAESGLCHMVWVFFDIQEIFCKKVYYKLNTEVINYKLITNTICTKNGTMYVSLYMAVYYSPSHFHNINTM